MAQSGQFNPITKNLGVHEIIKKLKTQGNLQKSLMEEYLKKSFALLKKQPNVLSLSSPSVVVGDIHGQFYDLLNIFENYSFQQNKFLFLGDYVDRGQFCIQVLTLLIVLKIKYPNSIYLLRGNHEGRGMTTEYNFKQQCCKKYSIDMYQQIIDWFKMLPLAAVVDEKYFCVHGGISPNFVDLDGLQKIKRNVQIPDKGIMCDILWSDPIDDNDKQWQTNTVRGVSYFYSRTLAAKFLKKNNFKMIIRAHQVQEKGYKFQSNPSNKNGDEPVSLTLFSAPNYCDKFQNKGAIAIIKNNKICIQTFLEVVHPIVLPNYINIFQWTLPYITACVQQVAKDLIKGKNRKRNQFKNLNQIAQQMQEHEKHNLIQQLLDRVLVKKNQFFPIKKQRQKQRIKSQNLNDNQISSKQNLNLKIPGPNKIKFQKIKRKVLKQAKIPFLPLQNH